MLKTSFAFALAFLVLVALPRPACALDELAPRDGLPNFHAKLAKGEPVRVAFLGGSITASKGWRVLLLEHLRAQAPAPIEEIFAAIPGTDSALGACRLGDQVLARRPDLLLVEFAVNDIDATPDRIRAAMEGIVRQTWRADPRTDLLFLYTLSQRQLPDLQAGRPAATARAMEEVAAHYGVPSIQLGVEVARQVDAGTLVFKGPSAGLDSDGRDTEGRLVFTADGTHPLPGGHRLYDTVVRRCLPLLFAGNHAPHALPAAITTAPWEDAGILPLAPLERHGDWSSLPPRDKRTAWQPAHLTPPVLVATAPGATLTFTFTGETFGILGLKTPDSGRFRVSVDDRPPLEATFFDSYCVEGHSRLAAWWHPAGLAPGPHVVRIELIDTKIDKLGVLAKRGYAPKAPGAYDRHDLYLAGVLLPRATR